MYPEHCGGSKRLGVDLHPLPLRLDTAVFSLYGHSDPEQHYAPFKIRLHGAVIQPCLLHGEPETSSRSTATIFLYLPYVVMSLLPYVLRISYTTNEILHHAVIGVLASARVPCRLPHVHAGDQRVHAGYQRVHAGCQCVHAGCQFSPTSSWCSLGPSVCTVLMLTGERLCQNCTDMPCTMYCVKPGQLTFPTAIISWITRQKCTALH